MSGELGRLRTASRAARIKAGLLSDLIGVYAVPVTAGVGLEPSTRWVPGCVLSAGGNRPFVGRCESLGPRSPPFPFISCAFALFSLPCPRPVPSSRAPARALEHAYLPQREKRILNNFTQQIIEEFRANAGRVGGPFDGSRLLLLTTTGARSGAPHTAVLGSAPTPTTGSSSSVPQVVARSNQIGTTTCWPIPSPQSRPAPSPTKQKPSYSGTPSATRSSPAWSKPIPGGASTRPTPPASSRSSVSCRYRAARRTAAPSATHSERSTAPSAANSP